MNPRVRRLLKWALIALPLAAWLVPVRDNLFGAAVFIARIWTPVSIIVLINATLVPWLLRTAQRRAAQRGKLLERRE